MLRSEVALDVPGHPAPKGSLKCVGRGGRHQLVEDNARTKPWRAVLVDALTALDVDAVKGQALGVEATFTLPRPATVTRPLPTLNRSPGTGDVDKLARTLLDALEDARVLLDDAQVVELTVRKCYPRGPLPDALDRPGVRVRVYPLEVTP